MLDFLTNTHKTLINIAFLLIYRLENRQKNDSHNCILHYNTDKMIAPTPSIQLYSAITLSY